MTAGDGLARVTYLPGVQPPPEPAAILSEAFDLADQRSAQTESARAASARAEAATVASADAVSADIEFADTESTDTESTDTESTDTESKRDVLGRGKREVRAENVSMHALARTWLSRWEMEKLLRDRGFDEDLVQAEIQRLERVELIDDSRVAALVVEYQSERKGLGRAGITAELRRRHIGEEHWELAFNQIDEDDEQERANEIAEKRAGQLSSYDAETAKRRLTSYMMRRGYSSSVVRTAVDLALRGTGSSGVRFR